MTKRIPSLKIELFKVPSLPGVYRFYDANDELVYVGKAKNLRRRLGQYKNAKRIKKHEKMRLILRSSLRLEFEICESDLAAQLLELKLIQTHRPRWNIAAAFYFLYPVIGFKRVSQSEFEIQHTFTPDFNRDLNWTWYGSYRSKFYSWEAFSGLIYLLRFCGIIVYARRKRRYRFKRLPPPVIEGIEQFLSGSSIACLEPLVIYLSSKNQARQRVKRVQDALNWLKYFHKHEISPLKKALEHNKLSGFLPQIERDAVFLRFRNRSVQKSVGLNSLDIRNVVESFSSVEKVSEK